MSRNKLVKVYDNGFHENGFHENGFHENGADLEYQEEQQQYTPYDRLLKSCACDFADLAGVLIWIVGCIFFLPSWSADATILVWGCILFIIGEWIYIGLYSYLLVDAYRGGGACSLEAMEAIMGIVGGASFFLGTVLFLPDDLAAPGFVVACVNALKQVATGPSLLLNLPGNVDTSLEEAGPLFEGTVLFVMGSIGFSLSSFFNAMGLKAFATCVERLTAVATTLHMGGGICFCLGSMGFIAQVGCGSRMVTIGAWGFIIGCILFTSGALVALARNYVAYRVAQQDLDDEQGENGYDLSDEDENAYNTSNGYH